MPYSITASSEMTHKDVDEGVNCILYLHTMSFTAYSTTFMEHIRGWIAIGI